MATQIHILTQGKGEQNQEPRGEGYPLSGGRTGCKRGESTGPKDRVAKELVHQSGAPSTPGTGGPTTQRACLFSAFLDSVGFLVASSSPCSRAVVRKFQFPGGQLCPNIQAPTA